MVLEKFYGIAFLFHSFILNSAIPIKNISVVSYTNYNIFSYINCCVEVTVKFNGTIPL